jgi:Cu(I)/Ag(I) efflux system membrane fusion protein
MYASPSASGTNSELSTAMDQEKQSMVKGRQFYSESVSLIREGMYINEGQILFSVNDLRSVWAMVSIPNQFIKLFQMGRDIELISEDGSSKNIHGKILLTEQTFEEAGQKFVRARILVDNQDNSLKINSLIKARLSLSGDDRSQVPSSAVFKTGMNAYVWVKSDSTEQGTGIFRLRKVITGSSDNGMTVIEEGLLPTEEIAMQAGLMADSETFLSEQ